jgi:hypothetical protein
MGDTVDVHSLPSPPTSDTPAKAMLNPQAWIER